MDKSWYGKIALITGGSSGIGAAIARKLAEKGIQVVLVARREERLQKLSSWINSQGGHSHFILADLSKETECENVFIKATQQFGIPDILINNAGLAYYGFTDVMPWDIARDMILVNVMAAVHLTRLFLPEMTSRHSGNIINIGSVNGVMPSQGTSVYSGSKAFLNAFTTALHRELQGSQVNASVIYPGPVATELFDKSARMTNGQRIPAENLAISAETVANAVWSVLNHPRRCIYVPWYWRWTAFAEFGFGWAMDLIGPLLLKRTIHQER
jgi:short-subunit dehydrogenase